MPQVWLSYQELGDWFGCDSTSAAEHVVRNGWSRRRCSDGLSRVKLPDDVMAAFLRQTAPVKLEDDARTDRLVAELKKLLDQAEAYLPRQKDKALVN